jgi:hypothetical protein
MHNNLTLYSRSTVNNRNEQYDDFHVRFLRELSMSYFVQYVHRAEVGRVLQRAMEGKECGRKEG